jgi:hypothetical protein
VVMSCSLILFSPFSRFRDKYCSWFYYDSRTNDLDSKSQICDYQLRIKVIKLIAMAGDVDTPCSRAVVTTTVEDEQHEDVNSPRSQRDEETDDSGGDDSAASRVAFKNCLPELQVMMQRKSPKYPDALEWLRHPGHKRFDATKPGSWADVRVINKNAPFAFKDGERVTHMCVAQGEEGGVCGMTFALPLTEASVSSKHTVDNRAAAFSSTVIGRHSRLEHKAPISKRQKVNNEVNVAAVVLAAAPRAKLPSFAKVALGKNAPIGSPASVMSEFISQGILLKAASRSKEQLLKQMRFIAFTPCRISARTLTCPHFRAMLRAGDDSYSKLTVQGLNNWLVYMFHLFLCMVGYVTDQCEDFHGGNPFKQILHDGVTLGDHKKYQSIGEQFVWDSQNWHIGIGFQRSLGSDASDVAAKITKCAHRVSSSARWDSVHRKDPDKLYRCGIADFAALGVTRLMELHTDGCSMHNDDKVFRWGTGDLKKSKNKIPVEPFDDGVQFAKQVHSAAHFFTWDQRSSLLRQCCQTVGIPFIRPDIDHNNTRVAAFRGLLLSLGRLANGIKMTYGTSLGAQAPQLDDSDFDTICEWEAIGGLTSVAIKLYQNEVAWTGAYKDVIFKKLAGQLDHTRDGASLKLIDHRNVSIGKPKPVQTKKFADFSDLGKECWTRSAEELGRRHSMAHGSVTDQDLANSLLDVRTKNGHHLSATELRVANGALEAEYMLYQDQFNEYMKAAADANEDTQRPTSPAEPSTMVDTSGSPDSPSMFCLGSNPHACHVDVQNAMAEKRTLYHVHLKSWLALDIDWLTEFPELAKLNKTNAQFDLLKDLLPLNLSPLYHRLLESGKYGHLPRLAFARLGCDLASGYVERMNSAAKDVMPKGYTLLSPLVLEMLTLLRVNKDFIMHFESKHHAIMCQLVRDIPMGSDLKDLLIAD